MKLSPDGHGGNYAYGGSFPGQGRGAAAVTLWLGRVMAFLSLVALWGMALTAAATVRILVATGSVRTPLRASGFGSILAGLAALVFLPPGSLPPFCDTSWGGLGAFACLAVSLLFVQGGRALPSLASLGIAFASIAFFAWMRGVPGSVSNLGTFVAVPVWELGSLPEAAALVLLGAGSLFSATALASVGGRRPDFGLYLRSLLLAALWTTIFTPWYSAPRFAMRPEFAAGVDLLFFWLKSSLVALWLLWGWPARAALPGAVLCAVGSLLLFFCVR